MTAETITVETLVAVPPEKAWQIHTEPVHITGWNFASDDWCCPRAENDLRPGGTLRTRMEAKDGSFGFDFTGVYVRVEAPSLLAYTLEDGRRVETRFLQVAGGTTVSTTFDAESQNPIEMQRAGWQAILDNYRKYAEAA